MNLNARFILWARSFIKKYGKIVITVIAVWALVIMINNYLGNREPEKQLQQSYNEDMPIMDGEGVVPQKYRETIKNTINEYFNYCKNKEYEKAYDLLTDSCKESLYENNIELFKEYVDSIYTRNDLTYYIQNYSNYNDYYIYQMFIGEDIEATGTTNQTSNYNEKISLVKNKDDDNFKIGNNNFIESKKVDKIVEETNMKMKINSMDIFYNKEIYNCTFTNRTSNYIVISDLSLDNEITMDRGNGMTKALNLANNPLYIAPNSTKNYSIWFRKYYDQSDESKTIKLNAVRIISPDVINKKGYVIENSSATAEDVYSVNIDITDIE